MGLALSNMAFCALPTARSLAKEGVSVSVAAVKSHKMKSPKRVTATPETQWGEWTEVGTSTITFPDEEFLYTGTATLVPTYLRTDAADATHLQYRFDSLFYSNIEGVEATPLYVDVYGNDVTVYSTPLPQFDLGIYAEYYPGPYSVCDGAVLYDTESYRALNEYRATPMSMNLYLNVYDTSQGEFDGLLSSGNVSIKLDVETSFSIPGSCVIGGDMGMGLLKVEATEDVSGISYALVKGDGNTIDLESFTFTNVIDRIINHDPTLMTMNWMAGDIMACPMEGPGVYTLGAVAYNDKEEVISTATCDVFYMPGESWNWTPRGNAIVQEDFLREVFSMNLENAGITPDGPANYPVEIEECKTTPGLYRLKNLYGPTHPYSPIFEYLNDFPVYTYIDCSNPQACFIYNMPTGFIVKDDKSGEIKLGCEPSVYFDEGFPFDIVYSEMADGFGKLENGVITFTPAQIFLSVPVYKEYLGYDWFGASYFTQNNFTVKLPEVETAIENITLDSKAEYFDLNGQRISRPTEKGVYIMRQGGNVKKVIR